MDLAIFLIFPEKQRKLKLLAHVSQNVKYNIIEMEF